MNQVAEKKSAGLPANMFEDDAAKGLGAIGQEDLALPFLKILGQLSPEVNKRDGKYVEGAEPGMIYNSVSGELYDGVKGVDVIPAFYKLEYIEWKDRGEGLGAPVAIYDSSSDILSKTTPDANYKDRLPNGNYVEKTAYFYVLALVDGDVRPAIIPMRSSNLTPARELNDFIANGKMSDAKGMFNAPSFAFVYNLKTVGKQAGSKSWHVYKPTKVRQLDLGKEADVNLWTIAAEMQKSAVKGTTKPKYEESNQTQDIV